MSGLTLIEDSTPELEQFMSILGDKITLQGWPRFRGGLDVKGIYLSKSNSIDSIVIILLSCSKLHWGTLVLHRVPSDRDHVSRVHIAAISGR